MADAEAMLHLERCTVRFGARVALDDVSLAVRDGERIALVGPNGAGKTTLLRELLRLSEGRARNPVCAYVPSDDVTEPSLRGRDYVMLGRTPHLSAWRRPSDEDEAAVDRALAAVDASGFAARRMDAVSSGERRRLALALALATEAPVLLLDEPTAHLDARRRADLFGLLARIGRTLVMTIHEFPLPEGFFTRIVRLEDGKIVSDTANTRSARG